MYYLRNPVTLKPSARQTEIITPFNLLLPTTYKLQPHNIFLIQDDGLNHKILSMKCTLFILAGKYAIQPVFLLIFMIWCFKE